MSDIFISYASEDRVETKKLAHALESHGWSVWWDRSIPIGQNYAEVIEAALKEALCVIVIWSEKSVKSEWVRAEVDEAHRLGKLFPMNIDGSTPTLVYRALQTADFRGWSGDTTAPVFIKLVADIASSIGESGSNGGPIQPKPKPIPKPIPRPPYIIKWLAPVSAILLLLSLLLGGALLLQQKRLKTAPRIENYTEEIVKNGFQELAKIEPEMVDIPQGDFYMGSPESDQDRYPNETLHKVYVEAFKMSKYEVSFEEYDQFCNATGCQKPDDEGWGRGNRPVINVSWEDATDYAQWLAKKTAKPYRLPTEVEWEYAARGKKQPQTRYPWGNDIGINKANCYNCGSQWDNHKTAPIGSFAANGFGLYDTVGNVWEWTCSLYNADYDGAEKKCAEKRDSDPRVVRGGSWNYDTRDARSAYRDGSRPDSGYYYLGFRLAQD